jgi:hypothetical protein
LLSDGELVSVNQRPPVTGFNPPRKVRKSEYSAQLSVKKGVKPLAKLGYN